MDSELAWTKEKKSSGKSLKGDEAKYLDEVESIGKRTGNKGVFRVDPELVATDVEENLRGFIKTRGSLIPGEEFVYWWKIGRAHV